MKRNLLLILLVMLTTALQAAEVSQQQAMEKAKAFMQNRHQSGTATMHRAPLHTDMQSAETGHQLLYAFNVEGGGFVIVSGDDRTESILGYSDSGRLDTDDMPDNMRWWLDGYAQQLSQLGAVGVQQTPAAVVRPAIEPMIKTRWYQNEPYNKYSYVNDKGYHSPTGCVATAMAQVMNYWQWPKEPCKAIPAYDAQPANPGAGDVEPMPALPAYTFQWDQMLDTYTDEQPGTEQQQEAVARLMQYCGSALHMYYGSNASDSQQNFIPIALRRYFDYAQDAHIVYRQNYTSSQWEDLVYNELANGRPIPYAGDTNSGGHSFICDGYDGEGLFHINWGWAGRSDGYFRLSILNPYNTTSTGARSSMMGFCLRQTMIVNVRPADPTDVPVPEEPYRMTLMSELMVKVAVKDGKPDTTLCFTPYYAGYDHYTMKFLLGLGVRQNEVLTPVVVCNEKEIYAGQNDTTEISIHELQLPVGTYHLLPIYKESGNDDAQWQTLAPDNRCFFVEVTPTETFYKVLPETNVRIERCFFNQGNGKIGEDCWLTFVLHNQGEELNSEIAFNASYGGTIDAHGKLVDSNGKMYSEDILTSFFIDANATDSLEFPFKALHQGPVLCYLVNPKNGEIIAYYTINVAAEHTFFDLELIDYEINVYTPEQTEEIKTYNCFEANFTIKNNDTRQFEGYFEIIPIGLPFYNDDQLRMRIDPGTTGVFSTDTDEWLFDIETEDYYLLPEITIQLWQRDYNLYKKLMTEFKTKPGCRTTPAGTEPIIPTAISDIRNQHAVRNGAFFDLQGRRVESSMFNVQSSKLKKGLYINNGKKYVVK